MQHVAAAAGVAKALRLGEPETANAVAVAGTALNALRVTRTGELSQWKGLAYPFTAFGAVEAAFLAARGITGPAEVFEGNKGFMDSIAGSFAIDWKEEDLERVRRTFLKRYNAEIHSQSALEGLLELREEHLIDPTAVEGIELETFQVAYDIIGGGEEGGKTEIESKEQADHSLPYLLAVALLDGQVLPAQFAPERILRPDVQALLRRVQVRPAADLTSRFPAEHACRLRLRLAGGITLAVEKSDYHGFLTRPMSWECARQKFERLAAQAVEPELASELAEAVRALDELDARDLTAILERARTREPTKGASS
jgi:2-methylcitrate dehydratase